MKHAPQPKIALELIQLVIGSRVFIQNSENAIVDVQALIYSSFLNEIWRKRV